MLVRVSTPPNTPPAPDTPENPAVAPYDPGFSATPAYAATSAQPGAPAPAALPGTKNTLGLIALIIAVATLVLSTVTLISQGAMLLQPDYNYMLINVVTTIFTSIGGLLSAAAIVLGAIGLTKKGAPKGAAGVGLGIGVATVWSILGNVIYSGMLGILY